MREIVSRITRKGQVAIPAEVRRHLGVGAPDKVAFVLEDEGKVALRPAKLTRQALRGIVPPLPGRESPDFEDQIQDAMEEEAERIGGGADRRRLLRSHYRRHPRHHAPATAEIGETP
jgi:AbrB family looped-hinge helix DNA binding protein